MQILPSKQAAYLVHTTHEIALVGTRRRVSGESLELSYERESLMRSFSLEAAGHLSDASEHRMTELARSAVELGNLSELERLSEALV